MEIGAVVGLAGILAGIIISYISIKVAGRRSRDERDDHLVTMVANRYVDMAQRGFDAGPHALACLGLEHLGSDRLIRQAIHEMRICHKSDPWGGQESHILDINLVEFFKYVHEHKIRLGHENVEEIAKKVRG